MNAKFINREFELSALEGLHAGIGTRGRLAVLYGRRRLGKTTLLRRFAANHAHCAYMADRSTAVDARRGLAQVMAVQLKEPTLAAAEYGTWYDLFAAFDRLRPADQPWLLVLDEYQYLTEADPAFSSYLQKWWDEHWRHQRLMLALCGSVTSMMYKETLAASSPLYGRSDLRLLLEPLRFRYLNSFFPESSWQRQVEIFAFAGGVPRYLEMVDPTLDLYELLTQLVLHPTAPLRDEGRYLLQEEITSPNTFWSILQALGQGISRISELGSRLQLPANQLTRYLSVLRDLCLVERVTPLLEGNPARSKKGIYRITDPFLALWFGVAQPFESYFQYGDAAAAEPRLRPRLQRHVATIYEDVCRQWCAERALEFDCLTVGRQWDRQYEFDVAGMNLAGEIALIGECKWSNQPIDIRDLEHLQRQVDSARLPLSQNVHFLLFAKSGFTADLTKLATGNSHLHLIGDIAGTTG